MIESLKKSIEELEYVMNVLRQEHGAKVYEMKNADGTLIAAPIISALVVGKAALVNRGVL